MKLPREGREESESSQRWTNPYLEQNHMFLMPTLYAITPYIPGGSQQFAVTAPSGSWDHDITVVILSNLDLKTLVNSSSVCKSFYSASKVDRIWRVQLCKFLPNVTVMNRNLCIFTPEQQYKVIFKRIQNECKPYVAKFTRNQEKNNLSGRMNELKTLKLQFQKAGGKEAASRFNQERINFIRQGDQEGLITADLIRNDCVFVQRSSDYLAADLQRQVMQFQDALSFFCGANYDGTIESIDPNSLQGKILNAINVLVPNAFNSQKKFESVIEKSVAVRITLLQTVMDLLSKMSRMSPNIPITNPTVLI